MGNINGRKHFGEAIIEEVLRLKSEGKTTREISKHFGFPGKKIIKNLLERYRRKQRLFESGIAPKQKGRPRKTEQLTYENKDNTIKQLRMENELLRSFLSEAGRR